MDTTNMKTDQEITAEVGKNAVAELASVVERAICGLRLRPNFSFRKPSWPDGLNASELNRLAIAAGVGGPIVEEDVRRNDFGKLAVVVFHHPGSGHPLELSLLGKIGEREVAVVSDLLRSWVSFAEQRSGASEKPDSPDDARFGASDLADQFGLDGKSLHDALRKRLDRWREDHPEESGSGWIEVDDRKPRDPKYIYLVGTVRPIIEALLKAPG